MGMTLYFCLIVIVTVLCTSESDAVHQLGGEYASHNPDWQHSFGATRDSHTTNATDVTYDLFSCAVTVIFYGRNLVPVKRIGSGDVNATGMPIVTTGSLSLGLLLWASFNMLIGWASTRCVCVYQPVCPLRYCLAHCLAVRL
ncbi:transmembrane protein 144a [Alosa alosa]|uniref:transmembrane protein 144a n=1 Tax=Alosa alosa TaxID=278164 RepID=UPI0020153C2B|nr:transmembrane protein 144a [Alosa alosa]